MKIRIGVGLGATVGPAEFAAAVDLLEAAGIDSLWLSEIVYSPMVEPFIGMTHALARTEKLKVGTGVAVLPGRHPVLVAKQLATLAGLAPARVLPVFGLRAARPEETALFDVPDGKRAAVFDEALALLRRLFTEDSVDFDGAFYPVRGARIEPKPAKPLDFWLGGSAEAGLRRVGRYADGWLASLLTPKQAAAGRLRIEAAAAQAGRQLDDDHYGISLPVAPSGEISPELLATIRSGAPGADPAELVAGGWPHARELIRQYTEAGLSKFVLRAVDATDYRSFVDGFCQNVLDLQN